MKPKRTLAPAAAPIALRDVLQGLAAVFAGNRQLRNRQAEMQEYFHVKHVFFVSSGKAALSLILLALRRLSSRRRVLIPAYTCFSVPSSIVKAGLSVELCDIDPKTLDFDYDQLEHLLDERTLCALPTHLLGLRADVDRVRRLCERRGAYVVEDAAQAMGSEYDGRRLGTLGDVGFFSLGRGKNITCGSGGIVITNSDSIARAVQSEHATMKQEPSLSAMGSLVLLLGMRVFLEPWLYWVPDGLPFLKLGETRFYPDFPMRRMHPVRGGLLRRWREHLEQANAARGQAIQDYVSLLGPDAGSVTRAGSDRTPCLRLPVLMQDAKAKRQLCALSKQRGLGISQLYPTGIQDIVELRGSLQKKDLPVATAVAERLVTAPVHHLVRPADRRRICEVLTSFQEVPSTSTCPSDLGALVDQDASASA